MSDWDKVSLAFDLLDGADVMEQFEEHVWLRVDAELWQQFCREVYGMKKGGMNVYLEAQIGSDWERRAAFDWGTDAMEAARALSLETDWLWRVVDMRKGEPTILIYEKGVAR